MDPAVLDRIATASMAVQRDAFAALLQHRYAYSIQEEHVHLVIDPEKVPEQLASYLSSLVAEDDDMDEFEEVV